MRLEMTPEELLTTTRAVRKRLDFSKPVEREVIEECLAIAQQVVEFITDLISTIQPCLVQQECLQ